MSRSERALELFSRNYNCAQAVYAACASGDGLSEAQRLALAAPFGGGIARGRERSAERSPARCWLLERLREKPWPPIPWLVGMRSTDGQSN